MVTIYSSSENTKRLDFVGRHLFNNVLGTEFQITSDKPFYLAQTGLCINYSEENLNHGLQIFPQGILFETGIRPVKDLKVSEWKGFFCFFYNGKGDIPFDLFSAAFYLLTLYEEYFPVELDEHGRFDHNESFLFQNGVLEIPVVDRWAYLLKEELDQTEDFKLRKYRAISTYDIDHPFLYRYKGVIKNTGGLLRDLLKRNFKGIKDRLSVQLRLQDDPYMAAIQKIHTIQSQNQRPYYLFVLLGKRGKYRRTTLYSPKAYYRYLQQLNLAQIGLHPSYDTLRNLACLIPEKNQLESILGQEIRISRSVSLGSTISSPPAVTWTKVFDSNVKVAVTSGRLISYRLSGITASDLCFASGPWAQETVINTTTNAVELNYLGPSIATYGTMNIRCYRPS